MAIFAMPTETTDNFLIGVCGVVEPTVAGSFTLPWRAAVPASVGLTSDVD